MTLKTAARRALVIVACLFVVRHAVRSEVRQPTAVPQVAPQIVRLSPADAERLAREARQSVSAVMPPGLELKLWAPSALVVDPIALDIADDGTVYATSTSRSGLPLDIRDHPAWFADVHTLRSVDDLNDFLRRELAPDRSATNAWLPDNNRDGSHDWRDLMVPKERIYRLRDSSGIGLADVSEAAFEGFNDDVTSDIAGGVLHADDGLYVAVAPDLWKLTDANGDGLFDHRESISHGYSVHPAFGGHDLSGLTWGPDGRIYWKVGDIGMNVVDRDGRRWTYANQGAIMRANPDGSGFEVFATGLRNLQEFAFDDHGNLVGVDNDGDYAGEVERVVYVTFGSDSGWRTTWQYGKYTDPKNNTYNVWMNEGMFRPRFDGQAAYITPPVAPGHSGPAGLTYDPGTALDDRWRGRFFVSSFTGTASAGRIYAFGLKERGAGFDLASDTEILRGVLTVGVKIGTNGALFLSDWITGWEPKSSGRIWTLDAPGEASSPIRGDVRGLLASRFDNKSAADLRTFIGHQDMRVRQKAQFELVRRGDVENLLTVANDAARPLARIHAIWGLGQLVRANSSTARVNSATVAARLAGFLNHSDAELRAQTAKVLGDAHDARQAPALVPLLADAAPRVRFFAAEALGRLRYAPAVQSLVQMLADNDDRDAYLRHAASAALASIGDAPAIAALASHPSRGVRLAAVVALRRLHDPSVARFLDDADQLVVTEAARAINDDGGIAGAVPALARVLDRRGVTNEGLVRRAIAANARLGSADAFSRLTAFAASSDGTSALRAEASAALAVWSSPSMFDRVDGSYLGSPASRANSTALSWLSTAAYWLVRTAIGE